MTMRDTDEFKKIKVEYIDNDKIFQKGLLKLFGCKGKSYDKIFKYRLLWIKTIEKSEMEDFDIKKYLKRNLKLAEF
jgi:hypothetical protein